MYDHIVYVMTHHFVHVICILFYYYILNDFILITFSNDILDIHITLSSIMDAIWMKICNEIMMSSFLLQQFATSNIGKICPIFLLDQLSSSLMGIMVTFVVWKSPFTPPFSTFFSIIKTIQRNLITYRSPPPQWIIMHCVIWIFLNPLPSQCIALSLLICLHLNLLLYLSYLSSWFWN